MRNSSVIVFAVIVLSFPLTIEIPAAAGAPTDKPAPAANGAAVLQGRLLKIEGDLYIFKDAGGKEVRVRVDKATVLDSRVKVGDKVDVQMAANGHAATLLKALE